MTANAVHIDRMIIEISAVSPTEGRQIALLVAAGLADAGAMPGIGDTPAVQLELPTDADASGSELAGYIIAATLRQLRRLS
jgi:hypothetical protein